MITGSSDQSGLNHGVGLADHSAGSSLSLRLITSIVLIGPPLNSFVSIAITPALPGLAKHIGADAGGELFSQLVMTVPAGMIAIFSLFAHTLSRWWGYRNCLIGAVLTFAVAGVSGMWAPDMVSLMITRLLLGAAGGVIAALCLSLAIEVPAIWRERVLGISGGLGAFFSLAVLSVGGILVDIWGWRTPMWFYITSLIMLPGVLWGLKGRSMQVLPDAPRADWAGVLKLWPLYLLMSALCIGMFMVDIQGPFLLVEAGVTNARTIGFIVAAYTLTATLSGFSYGWARAWLGEQRVIVMAAFLLGGGLCAIGLSPNLSVMQLAFLLPGLGVGWISPSLYSAVLTRADANNRVLAMGLIYASIFVSLFINPLLLSGIRMAFGLSNTFLIVGVVSVSIGILVSMLGIGRPRSQLA